MNHGETVRSEIKRILIDTLELEISPEQIRDDDLLFGHGMGINSVEALMVLRALEDHFGVQFDDDEIGVAMFQDVSSLGASIQTALVSGASARE